MAQWYNCTTSTTPTIALSSDYFTIKNNDSIKNIYGKTDAQILQEKIENFERRLKELEKMNEKPTVDSAEMIYCEELDVIAPFITKVEVLNPGKVMRFTFSDNTIIKTVCTPGDTFDFKFAFFLAYAKYFWENTLTSQGVENKARAFMEVKFFNSLVKKGMKVYFNQKKEEEREEREKAERKEIKARQAAKKAIKKAKKRENRINEIAEAISRAKASE